MKNLILVFILLPLFMFGQEEEKQPNLWEVVNMKVERGKEDAFKAAVKAHNNKFHAADGDYSAFMVYNISGPLGGTYSWIMGPTSWTAMDTRPGEGAHDEDWKKVDQYVESYNPPSYWRLDDKISHIARDERYPKRVMWAYDIKKGEWDRFAELLGKVKEVYEEKRPDDSYWVVWNEFANGNDGWDAIVIFGMDKWAEMDENNPFAPDFEAVHGVGSWHHFLNDFSDVTESRQDWIREVVD